MRLIRLGVMSLVLAGLPLLGWSAEGAAPALIAFSAHFGPGFYWFAAYCVFSLASQQYTGRLVRAELQEARLAHQSGARA